MSVSRSESDDDLPVAAMRIEPESGDDEPMGAMGDDCEPKDVLVRRGRPCRASTFKNGGAFVLVVIVASTHGRWSQLSDDPQLRSSVNVCRRACNMPVLLDEGLVCRTSPAFLGLAVVKSWQFVDPTVQSSAELHVLMDSLRSGNRSKRTEMGFLESPILRAVPFRTPIPTARVPQFGDMHFGQSLADKCGRENIQVESPPLSGQHISVQEWLNDVEQTHGVSIEACQAWDVWRPLGEAMVRKAWPTDCVAVVAKDRLKRRLCVQVPSRQQEKEYRNVFSAGFSDVVEAGNASMPRVRGDKSVKRSGACAYQVHHLVNALRASKNLTSSQYLSETVQHCLRYQLPNDGKARMLASDIKVPLVVPWGFASSAFR
jgi:hypothetical protein